MKGLTIWGSKVWVHDTSNLKLGARAKEGRWIGYDEDLTNAHQIYWADKQTVTVERSVRFKERDVEEVDISGGGFDDGWLEGGGSGRIY